MSSTENDTRTGTSPGPPGGGADSGWDGLVDRFLRVPVFLKIVLANTVLALMAGVSAFLLTQALTQAPLAGGLALALALFVIATLAVTTLLNAVVVRLALSPLVGLEETAERVRQGNLSARVPMSRLADQSTRSLIVLFNRMMDTLQAGRRRQKELARRILDAEERERERIAHELYAGPAQSLAGVMIRLRLATRRVDDADDFDPDDYEEIRDEVAATLDEIRALARRLRPPELDELGVQAALEAHARTLTEGRDIRVTVHGSLQEKGLHPGTAIVLFRILQEAVTNSVIHSGGRSVDVRFSANAERLAAEVSDDGHGFDPLLQLRTPPTGLGISGMQERASYAGGTVTVASSAGRGTKVRVELPWKGTPWSSEVAARSRIAAELGILEEEPARRHAIV
ncbi:MAG: sensor histidine kinase [Gemmatimonadota bacterium]|jgi:two-component system sensor histidine kinase UhpB